MSDQRVSDAAASGSRESSYRDGMHICRSWTPPDPFVDECPCVKAPCGMVDGSQIDPDCDQHGLDACQTIRGNHLAADCPGETPETRVQQSLLDAAKVNEIRRSESEAVSTEGGSDD